MGHVIGSGTIALGSTSHSFDVEDKYVGKLGLMLSGTFGAATVNVRAANKSPTRNIIVINVPTPFGVGGWQMTTAGLFVYRWPAHAAGIGIFGTSADGATDIDFVLFLPSRP